MKWECLSKDQLFSLMSTFSIVEASALIAGHPPSSYREQGDDGYGNYTYKGLTNPTEQEQTTFDLAVQSITSAIEIGELKAIIKTLPTMQLYKTDTAEEWQAKAIISSEETRIKRDDLLRWLASRNCYPPFFSADKNTPKYLIKDNNPQYSPKLCALVYAWEATKEAEENNLLNGLSPKGFASKWLKENAHVYGVEKLSNYNDMATMINWSPQGGRTSSKATPNKSKATPNKSKATPNKSKATPSNEMPTLRVDINEKKIELESSLVIQKSDLEANPYIIKSNNLDDDLPF